MRAPRSHRNHLGPVSIQMMENQSGKAGRADGHVCPVSPHAVNGARLFLGTAPTEASRWRQRALPVWVSAPTATLSHRDAFVWCCASLAWLLEPGAWSLALALLRCCGGPSGLRLRQYVFEKQRLRSILACCFITACWSPRPGGRAVTVLAGTGLDAGGSC